MRSSSKTGLPACFSKCESAITCYPTYDGSGIVATELGLELANRGHEVHFITYANPIRLNAGLFRFCDPKASRPVPQNANRHHVLPTYGGSGIVATELGLELANRGHEVHFITYANPIRLNAGLFRFCDPK